MQRALCSGSPSLQDDSGSSAMAVRSAEMNHQEQEQEQEQVGAGAGARVVWACVHPQGLNALRHPCLPCTLA